MPCVGSCLGRGFRSGPKSLGSQVVGASELWGNQRNRLQLQVFVYGPMGRLRSGVCRDVGDTLHFQVGTAASEGMPGIHDAVDVQ
jgi:hypothetical protein